MATTTLKAIIDRFQAVLEAAPLSLVATKEPFSHDRQPNAVLNTAYRVEDAGLSDTASVSNGVQVRRDTLRVWVARKVMFAGQTSAESLHDTLVSIERAIKADGASNSYHAEITGREITREGDILTASVDFVVDYDFSEV